MLQITCQSRYAGIYVEHNRSLEVMLTRFNYVSLYNFLIFTFFATPKNHSSYWKNNKI